MNSSTLMTTSEVRNNIIQRLRDKELVSIYELRSVFPTDEELEKVDRLFPDARIAADRHAFSQAQQLRSGMMTQPKRSANKGRLVKVPVCFELAADGTIAVHTPVGCPPDGVGYNKNRAAQAEKKTKIAAKLRAKLEARDE